MSASIHEAALALESIVHQLPDFATTCGDERQARPTGILVARQDSQRPLNFPKELMMKMRESQGFTLIGATIVLVKKPDRQFVPITLSLYQKN